MLAPATASGIAAPGFIGRGDEARRLRDALCAPPSLILVEGEAGVGKTRLIEEVLAAPLRPGTRVLVGHCHDLRQPLPLDPLVQALRRSAADLASAHLDPVAGALRPLLPELSALPPLPEPVGDPGAERHRVYRGVVAVLEGLAPAVLVLEDLHWADDTLAEALRFLVAELPNELAVVLSWRPEDLPPILVGLTARHPPDVHVERVRVPPLTPDEIERFAEMMLPGEPIPEGLVRSLQELTGGLPFALEEVLKLHREQGGEPRLHTRWAGGPGHPVPESVRESVLVRVSGLPDAGRRVVEAAAVLGLPAAEGLLLRVAGADLAGLRAALASGLLREVEGGVGLRHALARDAVDGALSGPERRRLHARAARALGGASPRPHARLAHHLRAAGDPGWTRSAERAADHAGSLGDDAAAARFLQQALQAEALPRASRARLALKLGRAALHGLAHGESVAILRRILDDEELAAGVRGELRLSLGLLLDQAGDASGAARELSRAVPELRRRPALAARAMAALAMPTLAEGAASEHLAWGDRALRTASRADDAVVRLAVLLNRAATQVFLGLPEGWRSVAELPRTARGRSEGRELVRGLLNLAQAAYALGRYGPAARFLDQASELAAKLGYTRMAGATETMRVLLDWSTGAWDGLEERASRLVEEAARVPHAALEARVVLGLLALVRGWTRRAHSLLRGTPQIAVRAGLVPLLGTIAAGLGTARLVALDHAGAAAETDVALSRIRTKETWAWAGEAAPVHVASLLGAGRLPDAQRLTKELARGLRGLDAPAAEAGLASCRGLVAEAEGRLTAAARAFATAERRWRDLPCPFQAARLRAARARCSPGAARAASLAAEALEELERLGAAGEAAMVRTALRAAGLRTPRGGGRRPYGDRLSPREEEVALLVAEGRRNREIAEALFLSPRTVEVHVANAMRKLGAATRTALALAIRGESGSKTT